MTGATWLLAASLGSPARAEPAPEDTVDGRPDAPADADEEVVVWGQLAIQVARDRVANALGRLGWRSAGRDRDGALVFRPPHSWLGRVRFTEGGELMFGRPVVGFSAPAGEAFSVDPRYEDAAPTAPTDHPLDTGLGPWFWLLPSPARLEGYRAIVRESTRGEVDAYVDVVRRTAFQEQLLALPDRLDATWADGAPLDGDGPALATLADRRRAVLAYWASRADTVEGHRMCAAVEAWLAAVVQASDHPIPPAERATYEAMRSDGRRLPE